ncbi:MAG: hypothetical protein GYB35_04920 [Algicola sp.]|nr:hypothetical protein [Algicola sp.]
MGILANDNKQLIYIYSQDSPLSLKVLSHLRDIDTPVRIINLNRESLSGIIWLEITAMLGVGFSELFRRDYSSLFGRELEMNLTASDWLKLIEHNPSLLYRPIAINGTKAKVIEAKYDIFDFYKSNDSETPAISTMKFANVNNSDFQKSAI